MMMCMVKNKTFGLVFTGIYIIEYINNESMSTATKSDNIHLYSKEYNNEHISDSHMD